MGSWIHTSLYILRTCSFNLRNWKLHVKSFTLSIHGALNNFFEIKLEGISQKFVMGAKGRELFSKGAYKKVFCKALWGEGPCIFCLILMVRGLNSQTWWFVSSGDGWNAVWLHTSDVLIGARPLPIGGYVGNDWFSPRRSVACLGFAFYVFNDDWLSALFLRCNRQRVHS